ncbi:MAG TPA: Smr/MutS family protein [Methylocella sp.]|nr:Smr/MutS family protein [Methylocella sp.]
MNKNVFPDSKIHPRRLREEEIELWRDVTQKVAPLPGRKSPELPQRPAGTGAGPMGTGAIPPGSSALSRDAACAERPAPLALAPLERRLRQKLARGKAAPEAVIDLHGMTREQAFLALRAFMIRAQIDGARLVLVVTGKGGRAGSGGDSPGVLRKCVPSWLRAPGYRSIVLGLEEAARPHGGAGALYVRLRRRERATGGTQDP